MSQSALHLPGSGKKKQKPCFKKQTVGGEKNSPVEKGKAGSSPEFTEQRPQSLPSLLL